MPRVTNQEVQQLVDTTRDCTSFIDTAHLIVNEELADVGHSEDRLKQIELYLSGHYAVVTIEKGSLVRKRVGDASDTYGGFVQGLLGPGLRSTRFGQQAISQDTSGTLERMAGDQGNAEFEVV